ncbi:MAG: N-acetylneuraminate synthase family protein [Bacteroidia bacterium]|nr:N-acetylneuraminate synthase family protein [Bacteroidia bacterium]
MKSTYIIGEIGQNHNGSMDLAKQIIDVVARPVVEHLFNLNVQRMNAIKLTKRDLKEELTDSAMHKPYNSPHSFGATYGEHRAALELNDEQHFELYNYAKALGLDVVETLCAVGCLSMFKLFTPDKLKVASRDLTNLPLLAALAETKIPIILSTGMGGKEELDDALETLGHYHSNISILHCISEYPAHYKNINLLTIQWLKENYGQFTIGYSDHSIGIDVPLAAVALGSEILEKHITIDRNLKGTDQAGSLGPEGIYRMVRDIRCLEMAMGEKQMTVDPAVESARIKLERSIATKNPIKKGMQIREEDLHMLSPGDGVKWKQKDKIIGKTAIEDIPENEIVYLNMVQ